MTSLVFDPSLGVKEEVRFSEKVLNKLQKLAFRITTSIFDDAISKQVDFQFDKKIVSLNTQLDDLISDLSVIEQRLIRFNSIVIKYASKENHEKANLSKSLVPACSMLITMYELVREAINYTITTIENSTNNRNCIGETLEKLNNASHSIFSICGLLEKMSENSEIYDALCDAPSSTSAHQELNKYLG